MAYVELGAGNGGILLNISEGGLALQSALTLTSDNLPEIKFQLPAQSDWIHSAARIAWLSGSRKEAGIQFIDLPAQEAACIRQWMAAQQTQEAAPAEPAQPRLKPPTTFVTAMRAEGAAPGIQERSPLVDPLPERNSVAEPEFDSQSRPFVSAPAPDLHRFKLSPYELLSEHNPVSRLPYPVIVPPKPRTGRYVLIGLLIAAAFFLLGANVGREQLDQWLNHLWSVAAAYTTTTHTATEQSAQPPAGNTQDRTAAPAPDSSTPTSQESATDQPAKSDSASGASSSVPVPPTSKPSTQNAKSSEKKETPSVRNSPAAPSQQPGPVVTRALDLGVNSTGASRPPPDSILVSIPEAGSPAFWVNLPPETVSASNMVAINCQRSIRVTPLPSTEAGSRTERVLIGKLVSHSDPFYPSDARSKHIEGTVTLHASFGLNGGLSNVIATAGPSALASAALDAMKEWRYEPTFINGDPVETQANITMVFRLP
jgi:TonB family protein